MSEAAGDAPGDGARVRTDRPAEGVLRVLLDRPEARNAIDLALARDLAFALAAAAADDTVRAVVLGSTGAHFSVGGDIKMMLGVSGEERPELLARVTRHFHDAALALAELPKPVVAAARGSIGGGGLSLLLGCDLVVVDEAARIALGFAALGLSPDGGMSHHLPRLVGYLRAFELVALNPVLDGKRAVELGLASRAVPSERVDAEALELATRLAAGPTRALARLKVLLRAGRPLAETLPVESESIAELSGERDASEGLAAFVARRPPAFRGL